MSVEQTLSERGQRYGLFTGHAQVTQDLKKVVRLHLVARDRSNDE